MPKYTKCGAVIAQKITNLISYKHHLVPGPTCQSTINLWEILARFSQFQEFFNIPVTAISQVS